MIRAISCEQADLLLAGHAVDSLSNDEHRTLRRHLAHCEACRVQGAAYLRVTGLLPLSVEEVEPPAALRSRILAAVHAEASQARGAEPPSLLKRLWDRIPAARPLTIAGALGTAAATAVAVVGLATHGAQPAAPAVVAKHVCGLTASPSACATLRYDPSVQQATMTVTGLPPISVVGGQPAVSYEVWLVRSNGSTVAAAFLSPSPDGGSFSAVMTGDMSQYAAVATTREPAGGSAVPTGAELLRVQLG